MTTGVAVPQYVRLNTKKLALMSCFGSVACPTRYNDVGSNLDACCDTKQKNLGLLVDIADMMADTDTMHPSEIDIAINMPVPRVEQAVEEADQALRVLKDTPPTDALGAQERFRLSTRTAESLLRVTWGERGGHYRPQTFKRLASIIVEGLAVISRYSSDSPDEEHDTHAARAALAGQLAWIESILAEGEGQ